MLGKFASLMLDAIDDIFFLQNIINTLRFVQNLFNIGSIDKRWPKSEINENTRMVIAFKIMIYKLDLKFY